MTTKQPNGLDLDALEREGSPVEPYTFTLGGKQYTATDPESVDWQVVMAMDENDPAEVLAAYLGDQYADFAKAKLSMRTITKLMDAINQHFATPDPGEADASPAS